MEITGTIFLLRKSNVFHCMNPEILSQRNGKTIKDDHF